VSNCPVVSFLFCGKTDKNMLPPAGNNEEYYTAVLVKIGLVEVEESKVLPFKNSVMMRNLLSVKVSRIHSYLVLHGYHHNGD